MWDFLDDDAREDLRRRTAETLPARRIRTIDDIGHAELFLMTNPYGPDRCSRSTAASCSCAVDRP